MPEPKVIGLYDALLDLWADLIVEELADPRDRPPYESDDFPPKEEETNET